MSLLCELNGVERVKSWKGLSAYTGLCVEALRRAVAYDNFPRPERIHNGEHSGSYNYWAKAEVDAWLGQRATVLK